MRFRRRPPALPLLILAWLLLAAGLDVRASAAGATPAPRSPVAAPCTDCAHDFGDVREGALLRHGFVLRNPGPTELRLSGVQLAPPLQLARMPAVIAPGQQATLALSLDTTGLDGAYEGGLVVLAADGRTLPAYSVAARVLPRIEVSPLPAFFATVQRGEAKAFALDIRNHGEAPLALALPDLADRPWRMALREVEPGRRFRLELALPASLPPGRSTDHVELKSSDPAKPVLFVGVHVNVRERVYSFPEMVDFGELSQAGGSPGTVQTLMLYQAGGSGFTATASSDIPGLTLSAEPGPQGDRVQVTATLDATRTPVGPLRGTITLRSNDPEQPLVTVPVTGRIAPR